MKFKLQNVRLSFPSLFATEQYGGEDTGKYAATFILDKNDHKEVVAAMQSHIGELQKTLKGGSKIAADKVALKDGDLSGRDELTGKMVVKATTKKRPLVLNRDKSPIVEQDNIIYAGCYVNAIITFWLQDNQYGKRVNASLSGVQFSKDGQSFGDVVTVDEFDDLSEFSTDEPPF